MARSQTPQLPLIAVVGATGTGKSELAVALARKFNGEIINGDAMQLYTGLPIITNKILLKEQHGIPHHLLGCIGLNEQTWVVGSFVQNALSVIEEIKARGKLPILVGGTNYYTQALLFRDGLVNEAVSSDGDETQHPLLELPTQDLLQELERVDPVMAQRWHPNDRRKIQRSLEIYLKTGKKASEIYAEQQSHSETTTEQASEHDYSRMRFPTLLFWVHAKTEALRTRLDSRVERMLADGLLAEVQDLRSHAAAEEERGAAVDETRGIWVSIGYKEFRDYATALETGDTSEMRLATLRKEALDRTQAATRQYAKRQVRWIRIKLLNALSAAGAHDHFFLLDSSDPSEFETKVVDQAIRITEDFLASRSLPSPASLSSLAAEQLQPLRSYDISSALEQPQKHVCEPCGVTCVTQNQWEQHTKSKAHRKLTSKRTREGIEHGPSAKASSLTTHGNGGQFGTTVP